jgi:hypothetical protein
VAEARIEHAHHAVALRRRAQAAGNRRRERRRRAATDEATRKQYAKVLTAEDFAALPPAERVSAVADG